MFLSFGVENNQMFNIYYKKLKQSGVNREIINKRINELTFTFKPDYGRKVPSVSDIIGINVQAKETGIIETAWQEFQKKCCNNNRKEPMPDWVFTIKKLIGNNDVEDMNQESEKWIKKEFIRIFPAIKSGTIKPIEGNAQYKIEGGSTIEIPKNEIASLESETRKRIESKV